MTTGWMFDEAATPATTEPGLINFDPLEVDFAIFRSAEVTYDGAATLGGFIYSTGVVAALLAMTF